MSTLAPSSRSVTSLLLRKLGPVAALAVLLTTCQSLLGPPIESGSVVPIIDYDDTTIDSVVVAVGEVRVLTVDRVLVDGTMMEIDELEREYLPHLTKINPEFSPDWIAERWMFKGPYAQPIVTTGYRDKIPEHRTPVPGLYLATMSQIYPEDRGQNYSIKMGEQVAALAVEDWEQPPARATATP